MPSDPNLVASVHVYETTGCNTQACWDSDVAPAASGYGEGIKELLANRP